MEKQNINLATSLPARQSMYLSFRFVKVMFVSFFSFLIIIYMLLYTINYFRAEHLSEITKEQTSLKNQIAQIVDVSQKANVSEAMLKSVASLKSKIAAEERVLKLLNTQQQSRFSVYLETLASEMPDNVWIDEIRIIPEQEYILLSGYSLDASLVSIFVHQLSESPAYRSYTFQSIDVSSTKDNYFRFIVTSKKINADAKSTS